MSVTFAGAGQRVWGGGGGDRARRWETKRLEKLRDGEPKRAGGGERRLREEDGGEDVPYGERGTEGKRN